MASPRFLLVSGLTASGEASRPWPGYNAGRGRIDDGGLGYGTASPWTAWRLLGRNNRELGRSADTYPTVPECVAAVAAVRAEALTASRLLSVDAEHGKWFWRLEVDGVPTVVSSRSYQRQRECLYSLEQFLAAVNQAELPAAVRDVPDVTVTQHRQWPASSSPARAAHSRKPAGGGHTRPLATAWVPVPVSRRLPSSDTVPSSRRPTGDHGTRGQLGS